MIFKCHCSISHDILFEFICKGQSKSLLRFFDQLRFYEVSAEELLRLREEVPLGRHQLRIEPTVFRYAEYEAFLEEHASGIDAFRSTQRQAFAEERQRWEDAGLHLDMPAEAEIPPQEIKLPEGAIAIESPVTGNVWKIEVKPGAILASGTPAVVLEAMKMEIPVESDEPLEILEILISEGAPVKAGQPLLIAKPLS